MEFTNTGSADRPTKRVLEGKAVVITGAGRGIGRALAFAAAREGAAVVVNNRTGSLAEEVAAEIRAEGGVAVSNGGTVADWTQSAELIEQCLAEFGRIDGLVNNAGLFASAAPDELSESEIREIVNTNLLGTVFCGIHAMRAMRASGGGSIVNTTAGSQMGNELVSIYGATKGAVASLTYCWAVDMKADGIRVNAVWPSGDTRLAKRRPLRLQPVQPPPETNAPLALYLLSDLSRAVTGQVLVSRGPLLALASHPDVSQSRVLADEWSIDTVARAFEDTLMASLMPVGPSV
jgi:NAD(P)-dependent dehydrogenase (short-subunit alcohol dehydrogenase family)